MPDETNIGKTDDVGEAIFHAQLDQIERDIITVRASMGLPLYYYIEPPVSQKTGHDTSLIGHIKLIMGRMWRRGK